MKIAVCSDLHLEFGDLDLTNDENADVLILSGDILVASDFKDWFYDDSGDLLATGQHRRDKANSYHDFLRRCVDRFPHVVFVMGNHEHYHGDFSESASIIKTVMDSTSNFHFLDNEWRIINGVLFFGGTLWTNMNNEDPDTMYRIRSYMNDFRIIRNTVVTEDKVLRSFLPEDTVEEHYKFRRNLDAALELHPDLKTVVVGHHAPSKASTHPRYKNEVLVNGAYSSNLDEFILDRRQIKLWTHGHTHEEFDYMIGTTRVVCNPRGYDGYEDRAYNFKLKYVEV